MVELPAAGAVAEPPAGAPAPLPVLGAGVDGTNVGGGAAAEPFELLGPGSKEGAVVAGPGVTVLGAADDTHDEQPELAPSGMEPTLLTPQAPETHEGA